MGFPDRIERTIDLDRPPAEVWPALTTADGLTGWFSERASIDLRPGGAAELVWGDMHSPVMRVERVEPNSVFGFTWPVDGGSEDSVPRTYVEFTLEPRGAGTRLTVVETGFAQLPADSYGATYDDHVTGWKLELDELIAYLAA